MCVVEFSRWRESTWCQALTYLAQDLEPVRLGIVRVVGHPRPLQATVVVFFVHSLVGLLVLGDLRVCVRW